MDFPKSSPEYSGLKALSGSWDYVYGPITSRRFGQSLGINILGQDHKICSFDCRYCDLGPTEIRMNDLKKAGFFASPSEIETQVRQQISKVASGGAQIDSIFFSGNGEPTLHPEFDEVVEKVKTIRDEFFAKVPLGVLTNGAHLDSRKVQKAMALLDLRVVKLDAGNDRTIRKINAPLVKETAESLVANARKIKNLILQSCFVQGVADNTAQEDLEDWMESVGMIKPELVQIYTLDRVPTASGLIKCDEDTLYTIAAKLEKRTRTRWKVFYN